jgi:signal transduction histidine kinase
MRGFAGPLLALLLIAIVEALYALGVPIISPAVVMLIPIVYTAAASTTRATLLAGMLAFAYLARHFYLNRSEYRSYEPGLHADDLSRLAVFSIAAVGLVAIARYRDRQREVQQSLQRAYEAAVEAEGARSQFLAVVSHELRTPLATIIQYTDLLIARIGGELTDDQAEMLRRIEGASLHLRAMIQQLLDYAQLGRGTADPPTIEPVELGTLVRTAVALLEPSAAEKALRLTVVVPDTPVPCHTDPGRIRQIVLNLVENAIKFTDRGEVRVTLRDGGPAFELEVSDTGVGIPDDVRNRVFEPFWQGEHALTRRRGGLGLGLAIVRDLVAGLGGEVLIRSEVGEGSIFLVRLPRPAIDTRAPASASSPPAPAPPATSAML